MESLISILATISSVLGALATISILKSTRDSKKHSKEYEEDFKDEYIKIFEKKILEKELESRFDKGMLENLTFEDLRKSVEIDETEVFITYTKHFRAMRTLQAVGRVNRLSERNKSYQKLWLSLNAGLIDSMLKNIMYNEDSTSINRNTIIGMLVGEKIKKDTKSFIYLGVSFLVTILLPTSGLIALNYWLVFFLIFMFSMLTLNQKVLEYRIANGLYGENEYEAREIIGYIENHSNSDDFHSGGDKKLFQEKAKKNVIFKGVYGELLN